MMRMDETRLPGSTPIALHDLLQAITALIRELSFLPDSLPRVIWQHERDELPCRIVQMSLTDLEAEQLRGHDAMGVGVWVTISWEGGWLREAYSGIYGLTKASHA